MTDEGLMERIQARDEGALSTLYSRHHRLFYSVAANVVNNASEAEDVVKECLHEIWEHAGGYLRGKGQALGWLITLVRRRGIDRVRRRCAYSRLQERLRLETEKGAPDQETGTDEKAADSDRAALMERLISRLPAAQRQALRLAYYRGMSQREIAAHTGLPLGTVKTRVELGLRKLRTFVLACGGLYESISGSQSNCPSPAARNRLA